MYRDQGKKEVSERKYEEAILSFTSHLKMEPGDFKVMTNIAICYMRLENYKMAAELAQRAIAAENSWAKGYYLAAKSLLQLGRVHEAKNFLNDAEDHLFKGTRDTKQTPLLDCSDFRELAEKTENLFLEHVFNAKYGMEGVRAAYLGRGRGKGIKATKAFAAGEIVIFELPIVSQLKFESWTSGKVYCGHCSRSILLPDNLPLKLRNFYEYGIHSGKMEPIKPISCVHCDFEVYCSMDCAGEAWKHHHEYICPGRVDCEWKREILEEYASRVRSCRNANPLVILKIFSSVLLSVRRAKSEEERFDILQTYRNFIATEEKLPGEEIFVELLKKLFSGVDSEGIISLSSFRRLNGVLLQNAQTIILSSQIHYLLNDILMDVDCDSDSASRAAMILGANENEVGNVEMTKSFLVSVLTGQEFSYLNIIGTGLYRLGNLANHSCVPNIEAQNRNPDHSSHYVALRDIDEGEELTLSYIDENSPYAERQKKLQEFYHFRCTCEKCTGR